MENLILILATLVLIAAERSDRLRFASLPVLRRHFVTDVICLVTGVLALGLLMRAAAVAWIAGAGVLSGPISALPPPAVFLLAVVTYDGTSYATHVCLHRSSRLWAFHKVHHSSRALDWLATYRAHIVEHALRHLASPVLLIALGFPLTAVAVAAATYGAWAAFGHSNLRLDLRRIEGLLITPRLHRLHHVPATTERNFGNVFSFWDRLFGTLSEEPGAALEPIGVPGEIETYPQTWPRQLVQPFSPRSVEL